MEYQYEKNSQYVLDYSLNTVSEQPVDADITLPDYCPDIERILRCSLKVKLYSKSVSGGQLCVEGASVIQVIYLDSVGCNIRSYEYTLPFSAAFPLKNAPDRYVISVSAKPEYVNCRAQSPRKLSVHGAFSLAVRIITKSPVDFCRFDPADDLELKYLPAEISSLCCLCDEVFSHSEDIALSDKPPVGSVISDSLSVRITELKSLRNKLMMTAQGELKVMYLSDFDKGTIEHMSYVFPITEVIDCEGVDEDTVIFASLSVMSYDLRLSRDALNGGELLSLDSKLCFSAVGYRESSVEMVTDAFSTENNISVERAQISAARGMSVAQVSHTEKTSVKVDGKNIREVIDAAVASVSAAPVISDGELSLSTKVRVCLLLKDSEGEPYYIERSVDFDARPDIPLKERVDFCDVSARAIGYRIVDDNTVELRIELVYDLALSDTLSFSPVSVITRLDDSPLKKDNSALILYYADKGESVWDISKNFSAKPDSVFRENAIDSEELEEDMMLLIPQS